MKNKILIIISVILIGITLSYLYSNIVFFHHHDKFKRFTKIVYLKRKTARHDFKLSKDTYLLKIKSTAKETREKEIFVNGLQVTPNIFPYTRSRKDTEISYIYLPKEVIKQGKNSMEIVFSKNPPPDIMITLSNYRKRISNDIYILFSDSIISPSGNISFKTTFVAVILISLVFGVMSYVLSRILYLSINRIFLYQVYSILPFLVFLFFLWIGNNLNGFYQVVITPYYFLTFGLVSFFVTESCLVLRKLWQGYKLYTREKKDIIFINPQVFKFSLKAIGWIKTKNFADRCILSFMILFLVCVFLLILYLEPIAEQLANIAYLVLVIGVIAKFIKLIKEEKENQKRRNESYR